MVLVNCSHCSRSTDSLSMVLDLGCEICINCNLTHRITCHLCGELRRECDSVVLDTNHNVCEPCSPQLTICINCENPMQTNSNSNLCINCSNQCEICGERTRDNNDLCNECLTESTNPSMRCSDCGEIMRNFVCSHCGINTIPQPNTKIFHKDANKGKFASLNTFGLEIEVEDIVKRTSIIPNSKRIELLVTQLPEGVGAVRDGSLDASGKEIILPPAQGNKLEENIRKVIIALNSINAKVSERCSIHVHARYPRTSKECESLFLTTYALEDIIFGIVDYGRRSVKYCKPLRHLFDIKPKMREDSFYYNWYGNYNPKQEKYDISRYCGLNFHSVYMNGTVEFRYHHGSLDSDEVVNWVRFVSYIIDYSLYKFKKEHFIIMNSMRDSDSIQRKIIFFAKISGMPNDLVDYLINKYCSNNLPYFPEETFSKKRTHELYEQIEHTKKPLKKIRKETKEKSSNNIDFSNLFDMISGIEKSKRGENTTINIEIENRTSRFIDINGVINRW